MTRTIKIPVGYRKLYAGEKRPVGYKYKLCGDSIWFGGVKEMIGMEIDECNEVEAYIAPKQARAALAKAKGQP